MRIVIAGASGFLGTNLVDSLRGAGHEITRLVRHPPQGPDEVRWDPYVGSLGPEVVADADVVVNVAGSKLLGNPRSSRFRKTLRDSRVVTTRVLADAIAAAGTTPTFVAQNASAWYGHHGDEVVTEESDSRGDSFMTQVARDWQDATRPAAESGSRVVLLRTVPVMARGSLTLNVLSPLFRLGLGPRLGDGRHWFPVISLRDWVGAAHLLVEHPSASGPFNLTSPQPATNREFTAAFGAAVHRPTPLAVPAFVVRLGAGPLAPDTLDSFRLVPQATEAAGYEFLDRDVHAVLRQAFPG